MMSYIQHTLLGTDDQKFFDTLKNQGVSQKTLQQYVERLKDWYKYQPHLPDIELDDRYLMRHIAIEKFDEEKAKAKIETLFTARTILSEFLGNRDPLSSRISNALEFMELVIMPTLTAENNRIFILKVNINNREDYDITMSAICSFMLADIRRHTDSSSGDIYIVDLANLTFNQVKRINLATLKKIFFILQNAYGSFIRGIHLLNMPAFAEIFINVVKTTLKKKVSERIVVYSSLESFQKSFQMKYLPKDMGGDMQLAMKEITAQWKNVIETPEMREWFLRMDFMKSEESKRLGKKDFLIDDMAGVRGTFRKLDLD